MARFAVGDRVVDDEAYLWPGAENEPMTITQTREQCESAGGHPDCEGVFIFQYADGTIPGKWVHLSAHRKA